MDDPSELLCVVKSDSVHSLIAYAFPPFPILSKEIRKARLEHPQLILIAPKWPAQPWFPVLQSLTHVPPLELETKPHLLRQPRSGIPHSNPHPPARVAAVRSELSASPLKSSTPRSASVSAALTKGGASSDLLSIVSKARREGTETLYDFRWKKWLRWCAAQNIPPTNPTSMQLANFLADCSSVLNLSASSVRGYRSAICTTIKQLGGPAFEADFLLREVARGASLKEAWNPRRVPLWDLFLVLDFIRKQPFQPDHFPSVEVRFMVLVVCHKI
ncbi:uncharacterized protein LOC143297513 [Babylonia areolata]|uniref:uncharacterized protein LOC143297513 n=1 Tax=Babylonia areolata TaxID=304850 RepID=UPI003FD33C40